MSRFFTDPLNVGDKYITLTDKRDIKHLSRVLRLNAGDRVEISDSVEWEYTGVIEEIQEDKVTVLIEDKQRFTVEPEIDITIFQGIPKSTKMETIVQKNVELGVKNITPIFMERTVVVDNGNFSKKIQRWQKISDEAVKQCRRGVIPEISMAKTFDELLTLIKAFDLVIMPYENEKSTTMKSLLRGLENKPKTVAIIIGPEGGFAEWEASALLKEGAKSVSLGKTILRTETAGIAAISMIMYELEM